MKKTKVRRTEMLPEYNFQSGVRGKYAKRYTAGTNVVVLSPDLTKAFPTSQSVNEALRTLVRIGSKRHKKVSA